MDRDVAIVTLSSKGQLVIPKHFRKTWRKGDKCLLIRDGQRMVMTRIDTVIAEHLDDLAFAKRTADAIARYERAPKTFQKMPASQFLEELEKW